MHHVCIIMQLYIYKSWMTDPGWKVGIYWNNHKNEGWYVPKQPQTNTKDEEEKPDFVA